MEKFAHQRLSPLCNISITVAICLSVLFCLTILIKTNMLLSLAHKHQQWRKLLYITIISGISCICVVFFLFDTYKPIQWTILQIVYLIQSVMPYIIMAEMFKNKQNAIRILQIVFVIYLFYNLICLIMVNVMLIRWLWLSLLYINIILESYFLITGFTVYYNPIMFELSLPIIPMVLIRPIIIGFTFVNVLRDIDKGNHNYYTVNISFSIIIISILPILTVIIPSIIFSENGSMGNPVFKHVGTHSNQKYSSSRQSEQYSIQNIIFTREEINVMMKAKEIIDRVQTVEDDINNNEIANRLKTIDERKEKEKEKDVPHPHPIQAHQTYSDPQIRDIVHKVSKSNVWDNEEMRQTFTGKSDDNIFSKPTMNRPQTETGAASIPFERDPASNLTKKPSETETISTRSHGNTMQLPSNSPNTNTNTITNTRSTQKQSSSTQLSYNNSHNTATDTNDVLDGIEMNGETQPLTLKEAEPG